MCWNGQHRENFSPLFIGESRSTKVGGGCYHPAISISVPSSSGSRVQHKVKAAQSDPDNTFQSPLHRGVAFNGILRLSGTFRNNNFSPLFIGESRSTIATAVVRSPPLKHFSPLFIGESRSTLPITPHGVLL